MLRRLKRMAKALCGRDFFARPDIACAYERFGSALGGWDVVTGDLNAGAIVYSFGVGDDASFDMALIERFDVTIHAFDPTPKSVAWVKRQGFPPAFVLHEYAVADFDGELSFHPPENPAHVSHTIIDRPATRAKAIRVPAKRLATIMAELEHDHIDLLKMDIEGAEYGVIADMFAAGIKPRQLLDEFHHRFENVGIAKSKAAIADIRAAGYGLFAVSSIGEEFGFLLKEESDAVFTP